MDYNADNFKVYQRAIHYINEGLIRTSWPEEKNPRVRREWMEWFLPRLDHPQDAFEAIHVAGTSGKGSVTTMIAEILHAAGVSTGLHISPYLQVATEKLWCNGLYASAQEFSDVVKWIRPHAEACRSPHVPLHGMASVGICLEYFRRQGLEVGVWETGVGGRSDLTNVLRTRVAVINSIGLDHCKTLGPTLEDIAWHKAGIIKPGCRAVVLEGAGVAAATKQAEAVGAPLRVVRTGSFSSERGPDGSEFFNCRGRRIQLEGVPLAMPGAFQGENAAMAVAAVEEWDPGGARVTEEAVRAGLERAHLPGRLERIPPSSINPCPVLLDGAHNPDKLFAMLGALEGLPYERLHVVYGAIGWRTPDEALGRLASLASTLFVTEPRVYCKRPRPAEEIAQVVASHPRLTLERDPLAAVRRALDRAGPDDLVLVTGSLYLCGEVRGLWYAEEQVVDERRSWF